MTMEDVHGETRIVLRFRGTTDEPEWFVDEILGPPLGGPGGLRAPGPWTLGDVTWEPLPSVRNWKP